MPNHRPVSTDPSQPTVEEKDNAVDGKYVSIPIVPSCHPCLSTDGSGKASSSSVSNCEGKPCRNSRTLPTLTYGSFSSLGKTVLFNIKEAHNHSFSSKVCHVFLSY